ncbi:hypothetical protein PTD2_20627 [Pseudoalteromonas tunicata D2]|uniref:Uncharacterized protein n=1 Tax=Pseudoalteromonas tunicata D2 TaxID=87626 RepID=A4CA51_9GAMM|nr:hypothetical protein PTD2_20627 [Pseudoalteromonas tunicata D2]
MGLKTAIVFISDCIFTQSGFFPRFWMTFEIDAASSHLIACGTSAGLCRFIIMKVIGGKQSWLAFTAF